MRTSVALLAALGAASLAAGTAFAQDEATRAIEQSRGELSKMAEDAVKQVREQNRSAQVLWDDAYGYAVFDTTKGGLIVTGVGGTGIAQTKRGGEEVIMHVGGAGVGLGAGLENYKLVLLIEDENTYEHFVTGQWDGQISAQASAGEAGVATDAQFVNGIAAYRLTEGGLMAQVDVTALRFWPSARNEQTARR